MMMPVAACACAVLLLQIGTASGHFRWPGTYGDGQQEGSPGCTLSAGFLHGVASGDPVQNSVVIWTRFTPPAGWTAPTLVQWFVSKERNPESRPVAQGSVDANEGSDFTVKVDVAGLEPDTRYYYGFRAGAYASLLGTTRTLPAPGEGSGAGRQLRFAVMSCANWRWGYFNVFNMTAQVDGLDFFLFLGDWVYEYRDDYPSPSDEVRPDAQPLGQPPVLEVFRARHRRYRSDPQLMELARRVPVIAVWDDHEIANNAWSGGAANFGPANSPEQMSPWQQAEDTGMQAWHEYLPIRSNMSNPPSSLAHIYRTFDFGDLATLAVTEQRLLYRTEQYPYPDHPYIKALDVNAPKKWDALPDLEEMRQDYLQKLKQPNMTLLGPQVSQLERDFGDSAARGVPWQLYGSQVIMGPRRTPDVQSAISELYPSKFGSLLQGVLSASTGKLAKLVQKLSSMELVASVLGVKSVARVLLGTGQFRDPIITDGWDGYQYERQQMYRIFREVCNNPIVFAGDSHNAWAYRLIDPSAGNASAGIEFDTASVSPPGFDIVKTFLPFGESLAVNAIQRGMLLSNPELAYANITHRGAIVVTATADALHTDYLYVDTVASLDYHAFCGAAFDVPAGGNGTLANGTCTPLGELLQPLYGERGLLRQGLQDTAFGHEYDLTNCPIAWAELVESSGGAGQDE